MSVESNFEPNTTTFEVLEILGGGLNKLETNYDIPAGYLKTALALHLPRFSESEIYAEGEIQEDMLMSEAERLARILARKVERLPIELQEMAKVRDKTSKVRRRNEKIFEVDAEGTETEVEFRIVESPTGLAIQENLHYIGQPREDTVYHFGLYREGEKFPFAYSAYSVLDRNYLFEALPFDCRMEEILVLTRAFNVNSSPANSMSLLFSLGADYIKHLNGEHYQAIISAVNPNILFKGAIFKGASFYVFATAPFLPLYYSGNYVTRKSLGSLDRSDDVSLTGCKIECKPTVWMGYGMNRNATNSFSHGQVINISEESYLNG